MIILKVFSVLVLLYIFCFVIGGAIEGLTKGTSSVKKVAVISLILEGCLILLGFGIWGILSFCLI